MALLRGVSALVAAGVVAVSAAGVLAEPLEVELKRLLLEDPQIKAGQKTVESSRQEIVKGLAGFLPSVRATGSVGPEVIDSPATRSVNNVDALRRNAVIGGVTVTENLFNGFSTTSAVRTARLNKEIAQFTLEGTRQNRLFEGIGNYVDILRQRRLVELARFNEKTIRTQLHLEDERVRRGSGIAVDVLQSKSRLQIAKERRVVFEGALEDAISRFTQTFGRAPHLDTMEDPFPPVDMLPSDLNRAIDIALQENPAVNNAISAVEVARERRRGVRSELFPEVDLVGAWNYEKNADAVLGTRRDYSLKLQTSWDLFTGFSTRAGLAQAAFDYRASKDQQDFVQRKVVEQTKLAWQALLTVRERVDLLENAVSIASDVFLSRRKLREAGKQTVIDVLDTENELFDAKINFARASYDEMVAIYQVLLAMGRLNPENLKLAAR